ncbi:NAD(P)H-dependent flavin oxidoreductase [Halobacillus aidingensis]|uniref:Probable nitronate monooxygenase n=1 Tax=Halobacillus aidingensis TaxID=240303 RepID=A0A1H0SZW5_HALAD|nr:nitronate monooxygenase [Halobacillus aidingensis]SDP46886.1 nitronate monooxygenase [Halobacillus aidingensis]
MWKENTVIDRLNIDYPIIQAGMAGGVTTSELVSAVSNAGGLGNLGAGYMTPEAMVHTIKDIKRFTSRTFGVNVFVPQYPQATEEETAGANKWLEPYRAELGIEQEPTPNQDLSLFEKQIEVLMTEQVPVVSFTFGVPPLEVIKDLKKEGRVVIGTATTVEEAIINEEHGMDMVVAQGSEAGGHRGTFSGAFDQAMIGTMSLVPQVVDYVKIPVIAAGGIMDGRGVRAALALGAQGAQLGTAFVTCQESGAKAQHKDAILNTKETETVVTSVFSGKPARGVRNSFIEEMEKGDGRHLLAYPLQNMLTKEIRKEAARQNRPEYMSLWSGQSPRLSTSQSASSIVESIVSYVERKNEESLYKKRR